MITLLSVFTASSILLVKLLNWDFKFQSNLLKDFYGIKKANELYSQLLYLNTRLLKGSTNFELAQYKFFTEVIGILLKSSKSYGTKIGVFLPEIKKALINDIRFEKKIRSEFYGGLFQMFLVLSFGVIFTLSLEFQLSKPLSLGDYTLAITLSCLGFFLYLLSFVLVKEFIFKGVETYLMVLYRVKVLIYAKIPLSSVQSEAEVSSLSGDKALAPLKQRLYLILENIKEMGRVDEADVNMLLEEMWFVADLKFEKFIKYLSGLKLFIIVFFFLSSFLIILVQSLESLAE